MAEPGLKWDAVGLSAVDFYLMVDQDANIAFIHQDVFDAGVRPYIAAALGLPNATAMFAIAFKLKLRWGRASLPVELLGDLFQPRSTQV